MKHTYLPKWNEDFTVLVTPVSEIVFRVLDRSSFLKDSILGERTVLLGQILEHYNGRVENLELNMDLLGAAKPEGRSKSGELVVVLNGLKIDSVMLGTSMHHANGVGGPNAAAGAEPGTTAAPVSNRSSILSGGIRARMRLRSTPSNSSTTSTHSATDAVLFGSNDPRQLRRHNEYHEQPSRPASAILPVSPCQPNANRNSGAGWDQMPPNAAPCNGLSQRSIVVNTFDTQK